MCDQNNLKDQYITNLKKFSLNDLYKQDLLQAPMECVLTIFGYQSINWF